MVNFVVYPDAEEEQNLKKLDRVKRVINGWEIEAGQWPWLVHLRVCSVRDRAGERVERRKVKPKFYIDSFLQNSIENFFPTLA